MTSWRHPIFQTHPAWPEFPPSGYLHTDRRPSPLPERFRWREFRVRLYTCATTSKVTWVLYERILSGDSFRYLSFDCITVPSCEENFMQLFFDQVFIETVLESHSYTSIQEALKRRKKGSLYKYLSSIFISFSPIRGTSVISIILYKIY